MTTLFVLGNINEHTFANSIVAANLVSTAEFGSPLREVYVLHSPESHQALTTSNRWLLHLKANGIDGDIITQRIIEMHLAASDDAVTKFSRYVETAVRASESGQLIVDLTNGTAAQKTLLSTVAYILAVPHLYTIDVSRLASGLGKAPRDLGFVDGPALRDAYVRSPDGTALDAIAHLSMTEVIRYKRIVESHTQRYVGINPSASDENFFSANLLHSIRMKLQGDRQRHRDNALYRIASSSIAASVEDLVRVLMTQIHPVRPSDTERLTFGERLTMLREHVESTNKADFDYDFFRRFNDFMLYLRNSTTHKGKLLSDVERFKADLAVKMSFPFLEFYADIVHPLLTPSPTAVSPARIQTVPASSISPSDVFYVGLDGDDTGAILEDLFLFANDEKKFRQLSDGVAQAIRDISKRVKDHDPKNNIIFAAGDDVLFRGHISAALLQDLQQAYSAKAPGQTCSIGYGRTFREVYVALKLAKTSPGKNAILGVEIR